MTNQRERRDRLRVVMLVTGFPTPDRPANGIFNLRAAKALSEFVDIKIIHLRAWRPRRRIVEFSNGNGLPVLTVTAPQVPNWERLNLPVYRTLGWPRVRSLVEDCDLIHSVDLGFAGFLGSVWGKRAGVRHVTQIITDVHSSFPRGSQSYSTAQWQNHVHGAACNSRLLANQISELFPRLPSVRTVYRGVDLKLFHLNGSVVSRLAGPAPVRFLYLGGFPSYPGLPYTSNTKGGETLLKAWKGSEKRLDSTGASLTVAGPYSDTSQILSWRANLKRPDRVDILGLIRPGRCSDCDPVLGCSSHSEPARRAAKCCHGSICLRSSGVWY